MNRDALFLAPKVSVKWYP